MRLRSERIVGPEGVVAGEVVVAHGRIVSVGSPSSRPRVAHGDELVDLGDRWLVPGFIDTHVHGGGGAQFAPAGPAEIDAAARFHARHGTTGLLATTVAAPVEELVEHLAAVSRCSAPNLLGSHLEGPFLSREQPGAMDPALFLEADAATVERLLEAGRGAVRVMTFAPEVPGALDLVRRLRRAGVVASIGHTAAAEAEVRDAVRAGATAATHVFNAMPAFHHRAPGAAGAVLDLDAVSCELICDGVHVDPVAMRLLYRAKGAGGVRLVTDAVAASGMPDGEYPLGHRTVSVSEGRATLTGSASLAGSTLTMEAAVGNAVRMLGISVAQAVLLASTNPARLLGLQERKGAVAAGLDADLVVLDEQLAVEATMIAGRWVAATP